MIREPTSCRVVNLLTARWKSLAARKARVFKRVVFNLTAYIDNYGTFTDNLFLPHFESEMSSSISSLVKIWKIRHYVPKWCVLSYTLGLKIGQASASHPARGPFTEIS